MPAGTQAGAGRKAPEKQEKEKKYPHTEERRKKTKRMGKAGTPEGKEQQKLSREREQSGREERCCEGGTGETYEADTQGGERHEAWKTHPPTHFHEYMGLYTHAYT